MISKTVFDIKPLNKQSQNGLPVIADLPVDEDFRKLKVTVEDLTVSEPVTLEKMEEKLKLYGGCIVKNYLSEQVCDRILSDIDPHLSKFQSPDNAETFISPTTRRVSGVCVKSKTAAEEFLAHPLNIGISNRFLGKENIFRLGPDEVITGFSAAQHNSCIIFAISPDSKDQPLHRDDMLHHNIRKYQEEYEFGTETAVGSVLALKKATKENGATRFIPGSHLWEHYRKPNDDEAVYAELDKGDCFFMLASCYHGGSANKTKDEERIVCILFMTQGTLRQEENIFLGTPVEYFQSLSIDALKALGLQISQPFCGWIENRDPIEYLLPESGFKRNQYEQTYKIESEA